MWARLAQLTALCSVLTERSTVRVSPGTVCISVLKFTASGTSCPLPCLGEKRKNGTVRAEIALWNSIPAGNEGHRRLQGSMDLSFKNRNFLKISSQKHLKVIFTKTQFYFAVFIQEAAGITVNREVLLTIDLKSPIVMK